MGMLLKSDKEFKTSTTFAQKRWLLEDAIMLQRMQDYK